MGERSVAVHASNSSYFEVVSPPSVSSLHGLRFACITGI